MGTMYFTQMLYNFRDEQSSLLKRPRYSIYSDTTLEKIAKLCPQSESELQSMDCLTPDSFAQFGTGIVRLAKMYKCGKCKDGNESAVAPFVVMRHGPPTARLKAPKLRNATKVGLRTFQKPPPASKTRLMGPEDEDDDDVYILELVEGRVYVGKSSSVSRRIGQHVSGKGSAFTREFPPTGKVLPRLGNVRGSGDAAERDETLRYMFLRGIQKVRGWKYTRVNMTTQEFDDAEANIREMFNLCRRCGNGAHFMSSCTFTYDRLGRKI